MRSPGTPAAAPLAALEIYWLGRAPYGPTAALQEQLRARVLRGGPEALLLCEHEPVITLGHSARAEDLLAPEETLAAVGVGLARASRGGRATYHGPGQLVAYPIVTLRRGVLAHVQALGEAAAEVARGLGVPATFRRQPVGVYVEERKLAAIGVHVRRRVAAHGLALNVTAEATAAVRRGLLLPCGEPTRMLTSLAEEARAPLTPGDLAEPLGRALCRALGREGGPAVAATADTLRFRLGDVK